MKPGQLLTKWWQDYVLGRLTSPQAIVGAARAENPDHYEDRFTTDPEPDGVAWDTPKRLAAPGFLKTAGYARQNTRADWQQSDRRLRLLAAKVVLRAKGLGIPLYVHSAFRTKSEQDELVSRGVSKAAYPKSAHNIGEAFDLVHGVYHWKLTQREWRFISWLVRDELRKLNAKLPKKEQLEVTWGGPDYSSDKFGWDPAHWEVTDYRSRIRKLPELVPVHMSPAVTVAMFR